MKMSFNDRLLIKNLYFHDRHSRYAKMRDQRNMVRVERDAALLAPPQRGAAAYAHCAKRIERSVPRVFEMRDTDDALVIPAMLRPEWVDIARRHNSLGAAARAYRDCAKAVSSAVGTKRRRPSKRGTVEAGAYDGATPRKSQKKSAAEVASTEAHTNVPATAAALAAAISDMSRAAVDTAHMPWLAQRRNARIDNYHERAHQWYTTIAASDCTTRPRVAIYRALLADAALGTSAGPSDDMVPDAAPCAPETVARVVGAHECERHASLAYTCYVCRRSVNTYRDMVLLSWAPSTREEHYAHVVDEYPSGTVAMGARPAQARVAHALCARRVRSRGAHPPSAAKDARDAKRLSTRYALYDDVACEGPSGDARVAAT